MNQQILRFLQMCVERAEKRERERKRSLTV